MKALFIFFLLLSTPAFAQTSQRLVFKGDKYPFSLTYTAGDWRIVNQNGPENRLQINSTKFGVLDFDVRVVPQPRESQHDDLLLEYYRSNKTDYLNNAFLNNAPPGTKISDSGITSFAGRQAIYVKSEMIFQAFGQSHKVTGYTIHTMYEGVMYRLLCMAASEVFDKLFYVCKEMYRDFAFTTPPTTVK